MKMEEVDHLLVKLKNAEKEIDIEMARIRDEAARARDAIMEIRRSNIGAKADVGRKTKEEVDRLLANLEKERVEIDGTIASIIDDEVARINAEAARENINEPKWNWMTSLEATACMAFGLMMAAEWCEQDIRAKLAMKILFG